HTPLIPVLRWKRLAHLTPGWKPRSAVTPPKPHLLLEPTPRNPLLTLSKWRRLTLQRPSSLDPVRRPNNGSDAKPRSRPP
ncbi:hypothetical protein LEMLEM_LOCUS5662, partial [Lemmus lemmus]